MSLKILNKMKILRKKKISQEAINLYKTVTKNKTKSKVFL